VSDDTPVALTSRSFSRHPLLRAELLERYANVTFNDAGLVLQDEALIAFLRGHRKAITALERLNADVFSAVPELRVISKYGVGLDMLDLESMERLDVHLGWTPGVNRRSVAELVIAFAIALLHRIPEAGHAIDDGRWQQITGRQLTGRTLGLVGCGQIGKDVARLASVFGCRILAYDVVYDRSFNEQWHVEAVPLEQLLQQSDIVTLHLPLDTSTDRILDAPRLAMMRTGAVLINLARGGLIDEACLRERLASGQLAGAALDVFASEPPAPDDLEFLRLHNVIVTPHMAGSTEEAILAMGRAAIAGLDSARPVVWADLQKEVAPGLACPPPEHKS
jgi:phosphoglycerate dehydrogenase-like enzyme